MDELKDRVRRELEQVQPSTDGLEETLGRVRRRRRNRRVTAGGLGIGLTVALVVGLVVIPRPAHRPATGALQGRIAFSRGGPDGGIYVMNPNGAGVTRITTNAGDDQASWSRDGSEIVFNRYSNGNQDVYVMRADGSRIARLTTDGASSSPAWSPDGSRIAFARETPGNADIYVMKADGTDVTRLTNDSLLEYTPAWSPDGSSIALMAYSAGPPPSPTHLYVMRADGSSMRKIGPDNAASPSWAPDGTRIAFVNEDKGSIYVINPDGTGLRRVVDVTSLPDGSDFLPNFTSRPSWSPDGTKLLFAAGNATSSHLYIVGTDGSGLEQLTNGSVSDESPAWSSASSSPRPSSAGGVFDMAFGDGTAWALTCDRGCSGDQRHSVGRALRIDPATGKVLSSVELTNPSKIAVGEGAVWVISFWDGTLTRIDPATSRVAATIRLTLPFAVCTGCADAHDFLPYDLAVGQGAVWVDTARGVVARIDPSTNRVAGMIKLPAEEPADVVVGEGAVWVAMDLSGVYRIQPGNDQVAARIPVSGSNHRRLGVQEVIVGGGSVWAEGGWARKTGVIGGQSQYVVANGAAISRIDPQTDTSTALFSVGGVQRAMAFDNSALWLSQGTTLERIDPRTGAVTGTVDAPSGGRFVAVGDGAGWAAMPNGSLERVNLPAH